MQTKNAEVTQYFCIFGVGKGKFLYKMFGTPNGGRTRVANVRGWRPRPLDDGSELQVKLVTLNKLW